MTEPQEPPLSRLTTENESHPATESDGSDKQLETKPAQKSRRRLISLISIGVVVALSVALWSHYRFARPVGEGPAGPVVAREAFEKPWSERKVVLLGLGDSVYRLET